MPAKKKSASSAAAATKPEAAPALPAEPAGSKGRIFLIDAMAFIFRAYHAMGRQRPMSNKAGLPTGATFVFVSAPQQKRLGMQG